MFNLDKFIADSIPHRPVSMFEADIQANSNHLDPSRLSERIPGRRRIEEG